MIWKALAAGVLLLTALAHSIGGYRAVLAPLLGEQATIGESDATLLRFTWHGLAVLMVFSAAVIAWPETPRSLLVFSGIFWLAFAAVDILTSRFAHPGWIPMSIAAFLVLIGAYR